MQILYLDEVDSTQLYLKQAIQKKQLTPPVAVLATLQTAGIGSRDNNWRGLEGNLFLSFALSLKHIPRDLKIESASIYFSYLLKETLSELGSKVILKWPNDFYIEDKKVGGMITNLVGDTLVCGVGLNLKKAPENFAYLDIDIEKKSLLKNYFDKVEKNILWKQVFSKYKLEFQNNGSYFAHVNNKKISLSEAILEDDGSLNINGERIYSLR